MLARAHKKFQRGRHSEIYLLTLKKQDKTKMELPLDMVSISASSCQTIGFGQRYHLDRHGPSCRHLLSSSCSYSYSCMSYRYSCISNVTCRSIIKSHNTRIVRKSQPQNIRIDDCNCWNKHACLLQNKCMNKDIVYKQPLAHD